MLLAKIYYDLCPSQMEYPFLALVPAGPLRTNGDTQHIALTTRSVLGIGLNVQTILITRPALAGVVHYHTVAGYITDSAPEGTRQWAERLNDNEVRRLGSSRATTPASRGCGSHYLCIVYSQWRISCDCMRPHYVQTSILLISKSAHWHCSWLQVVVSLGLGYGLRSVELWLRDRNEKTRIEGISETSCWVLNLRPTMPTMANTTFR